MRLLLGFVRDDGLTRRSRRRVRFLSRVFLLVAALVLAGCSSPYSDDVTAYIPDRVDGQPVDDAQPQARALQSSIATDLDTAASGAAGEPTDANPRPPLVLVSVSGEPADVEQTYEDLLAQWTTDPQRSEPGQVDGVASEHATVTQGNTTVDVAFARPRDDVGVFAVSFRGNADAAEDAVAAMIEAGEN